MLRAIDISSWQAGIVPSQVDCDIVIVKATGGAGYVNPYWREWADDVLASGRLLALYHFANDLSWGSAADEARHFLDTVRDYKGSYIPILDWEGMALNNDVSWAREWLDIVAAETGATPIFYAYASYVAWKDLSSLTRYPLWMASYLNRYDGAGWVDDPDNVWGTGSWDSMVGYQYTSTGYVGGYGGRLDLSVFYMSRGGWLSMQGGNKMNRNAEMVDLLMPISTQYVLGGSRYEPYDTDCSGMVCAAFYQVFGIDPYSLGDYTGSQWSRGVLAKMWWGTTPDLPWDDMVKGDVIFTSDRSPDFSTTNGSHVGFYTGDPARPFLSHYANGGPYVTAVNGVYGGAECYFGVARYLPGLEDDVSAQDFWNYVGPDEPFPTGADAWVRLVYIDKFSNETVETVREINKKVDELNIGGIDYAKLAEAVANGIDYDKLAVAVADEQARRMAE